MRIEDGYLITETPEEAEMIFIRHTTSDGDEILQPRFQTQWSGLNGPGEYHPIEGVHVRRRLDRCTPEVLKRAGIIPDTQSQEFSPF